MAVFQKTISCTTANGRPDFVDITDDVRKAIRESHIEQGMVVCQTPHTTCSVIFEEYVHDLNYFGQEFLQSDLIRILDGLVPRETEENREYRYPGPMHLAAIAHYHDEHPEFPKEPHTMLNGDAHLRASFFGSSQTFVVSHAEPAVGEFGHIYLVDWDQNRERTRHVCLCVMGE